MIGYEDRKKGTKMSTSRAKAIEAAEPVLSVENLTTSFLVDGEVGSATTSWAVPS